MKNILVTGGAGFIGSNFVRYLIRKEPSYKIFVLDSLTYAGSIQNLSDILRLASIKFIEGDINDQEMVTNIFTKEKIDTVVHFAAESHVDRSIVDPSIFIKTNVLGTFTLLETARKNWDYQKYNKYRFHHVSTDEVYGTLLAEDDPFSEDTCYDPRSPYSASKASSDHIVRSYHYTYGLPVSISNCSNNYGPYQFPEKFIPLVILNALSGKAIPVYGDGQQIRDWLYVEDHCAAIYTILEKGSIAETYNIGGGNQPTNIEIVQAICSILDEKFPASKNFPHQSLIKFVKDRPGHDRRYAMNFRKITSELNWCPKYTLIEGLTKTVGWYLDHQEWLQKINKEKNFDDWLDLNYNQREME